FADQIYKAVPKGKTEVARLSWKYSENPGLHINEYEHEQVNINVVYPSVSRNDKDYIVSLLIESLLGGSRGRIHEAVRGNNNLAYFAYPSWDYNDESGYISLISQTSADKLNDLTEVLENEMIRLKTELVTQEELSIVIDEREKIIKSYLSDNRQPYTMTSLEAVGRGYDFNSKVIDLLKAVTPEDVRNFANKYFNNPSIYISKPSAVIR
ncbi:MAG: insulinase family protein, partial [Candidatus Cloacimonetes bacterium]|nr:insulinase family protein [Candidatus Cloacimonadota bacterium]